MKRRSFIQGTLAVAGTYMIPGFGIQNAFAAPRNQLVFIFLRGGADALSLFSPLGAAAATLATHRQKTLVTIPKEFTKEQIDQLVFSPTLQMHPFLRPLLVDEEVKANFNVILHAGSLNETRSHFEQMSRIEAGDMSGVQTQGFLARSIGMIGNPKSFSVSVGVAASLRGVDPLVITDPGQFDPNYSLFGWKQRMTRAQRLGMYQMASGESGDALINRNARKAESEFNLLQASSNVKVANLIKKHGYTNSQFAERMATTAELLDSAVNPAIIAVDADHAWDTHASQETNGLDIADFGAKVNSLGKNLLAFKKDLKARGRWETTTIVVMSEFGRTIKENADAGTDHGRGGVMMLMGGGIRRHSDTTFTGARSWTLPTSVDSSSALAVTHDYRLVLAEILERRMGVPANRISELFAGQIDPTRYLRVTI